jgi:SAM-dependent methyltransferase
VSSNSPDYRAIWNTKPSLRAVYADIYKRILANSVPGSILEIGGGSGNFKATVPHAVSSDIVIAPWLDVVCDAQRLPFADNSLSNIVMMDVLHHIENPVRALTEACRVLRPNGHLIACEPAITPVSGIFYRLMHPEPVDMSANPLTDGPITVGRDPFDSNQAIPTLLVGRFRDALKQAVPELDLVSVDRLSFLAYPLSGGFKSWSLLPNAAANALLTIEWRLRKLFGPIAAFRLLAVYKKLAQPNMNADIKR